MIDVVDLHLDAGHAVALVVEGLRLVEIGVDELAVVLIEARLEHRDDAELLRDRRARLRAERDADRRRGDLHAVADVDAELLRERLADDGAGELRDLLVALARIGIDGVGEHVDVGEHALVAAVAARPSPTRPASADRDELIGAPASTVAVASGAPPSAGISFSISAKSE